MMCFVAPLYVQAQNQPPAGPGKPAEKPKMVELLPGAGELIGDTLRGENIRKVKKDTVRNTQVQFRQGGTYMYCDSATQFLKRNYIVALGKILLLDDDSTTVFGDTLYYDGNARIARMRGNVILNDKGRVVNTSKLDYHLNSRIAYYFGGGTVKDDSSSLRSEFGTYNTATKVATFRKNVAYHSPSTQLYSDTLTYNSNRKLVLFNSRTRIRTRNGDVVADGGEYNERLGTSKFKGRAKIETEEYTISGDFLDYNRATEKGIAKKNVEFYGKKDNVIILGDEGHYDGRTERNEVFGNAVMIKPQENSRDTLFLSADTLISYTEKSKVDSIPDKKRLIGYRNVKAFRSDFQAKADSIGYNLNDSTIHFHYDPVVWAKGSQLTAERLEMQLKKGIIDQMKLFNKAFVISLDTVKNFNQTKGRDIVAQFRKGSLRKVYVNGNGESIFYALEQDTLTTGLNYMKCSDMIISFNDSSRLSEILFIKQPEGKFIPPHEIKDKDKQLENFNWRIAEQPKQGEVLGIHAANSYKSGELAGARLVIDDVFKVFVKAKQLIFYKQMASKVDITPEFVVRVYPKDKTDIPIERRKEGYVSLDFQFPEEELLNGTAKHSLPLPEFGIARILVGQRSPKKQMLWQKVYIVK